MNLLEGMAYVIKYDAKKHCYDDELKRLFPTMKLDFVNDNENAMKFCGYDKDGQAQKLPVAVLYFELKDKMEFVTSSGTQTGKPGDIVLVGKDHAWPVSKEYFQENYKVLRKRVKAETTPE